jgi:hypothetical protein
MNSPSAQITSPLHACGRIALLLALAAPVAAFADAAPADVATPAADSARIRPLVGALLTGTYANDKTTFTNPDGSTVEGNLGGRYEGFAGAEFPIDPNGLALRLTLGIHTTSMGSHGERFTRYPLEATLWYPLNDSLRVGGGARYAARIRFSGPGGNTSDHLTATPSLLLGVGCKLLPHLWLDLRYAYERYEQEEGADVDGSHFGLGVTAIY